MLELYVLFNYFKSFQFYVKMCNSYKQYSEYSVTELLLYSIGITLL